MSQRKVTNPFTVLGTTHHFARISWDSFYFVTQFAFEGVFLLFSSQAKNITLPCFTFFPGHIFEVQLTSAKYMEASKLQPDIRTG